MTRSCTCKRITIAFTMFVVATVASPAAADDVLPGIDLFETPPGSSSDAFNSAAGGMPIPADFFFPGSDPFDGSIALQGNPLGGPFGLTDTIVERLLPATLPCPSSTAIPIEIVALDLVSTSPITVTENGGQNPTQWDVRVCLSDCHFVVLPDPLCSQLAAGDLTGSMTIDHTHSNGGTFDSSLPVLPKFIFTPVVAGPPQAILDAGLQGAPPDVLTASNVPWVHTAYNAFGITQVPGGLQVDGNCDGIPDPPLPGTSNFVPGVGQLQSDCATPPIDPNNPPPGGPGPVQKKELTPEQALLAAHGVLPAEQEQLMDCCLPDKSCVPAILNTACTALGGVILPPGSCTAPEACCLPDGTCITADPICCLCNGGTPQGPGSICTLLEACCLPDDTCVMLDPLCCADQGGVPQGAGSACTATEACCQPDGTCVMLDPLCCTNQGGRPQGSGSACQGDNNGNGIDDVCEEIISAISDYGLVALLLLTVAAGVMVIHRVRRGHTAG